MKLARIIPFFMAPLLIVATGCAGGHDDDATANDNAFSSGAGGGVEFSSAVGALVVDGKKLCTAALVDVDAGARIGPVSAEGRQIVFGGACVGQLRNGTVGAAVFVSQQNGLSISTPILSFDFESQTSAALAVGILASKPSNAQPLDVVGTSALVNAGAHVATVLHADENGVLIGAAAEIHAGVAFSLQTDCASFQFAAQAGVAAGVAVAVRDDGLGAAALVRFNGKLHFAAHVDGQCIARHFENDVNQVSGGALATANKIADDLNGFGIDHLVVVDHTKQQVTNITIRMTDNVKAIRVNGQGHLTSQTFVNGSSQFNAACDKLPLLFIGGPCELRPLDGSGFRKGQLVTVRVDTHLNLFPDGPDGMALYISTTNEAAPSQPDPAGGGG